MPVVAALPKQQTDDLARDLGREFSVDFIPIPATKSEFKQLIVDIDAALDAVEANLVAGLKAGSGKTWLAGDAKSVRLLIERIAAKRKEAL